jgi:DNA-binding IclR family transcriptional regulator
MSAEIRSIKRAFDVLLAVAEAPDRISLTEIARRVDLAKSTVARVLATLEGLEAVEHMSGPEGYRLGPQIVKLAARVAYPRTLTTAARPYLEELAQLTGETLTLCIPDGDQVLYIDQVATRHSVQLRDYRGRRAPLHSSCDGKLFLAFWREEPRERYLGQPLERLTPNTITDAEQLRAELAQIRRQGYAWTNGEGDVDVVGVAAPIRDQHDELVASICVFGPAFRMPTEAAAGALITGTQAMAARISAHLRGSDQRADREG